MLTSKIRPFSSATSEKLRLNSITQLLERKQYRDISHKRMSAEINKGNPFYQGLTVANYQNKAVMIKWQLQQPSLISRLQSHSNMMPTPIEREMSNLTQIHSDFANAAHQGLDLERCVKVKQSYNFKKAEYGLPVVSIIDTLEHIPLTIESELWQLDGFVMPHFQQGSVKDYLHTHSLSNQQKWQLFYGMVTSIASLHQAGWIHGDIKPSNFLIDIRTELDTETSFDYLNNTDIDKTDTLSPNIIISDLGNAQNVNLRQPIVSNNSDSKGSAHLDSISGTPAYIAPECWQGCPISVQSDLYALGVVMYEVLAGNKPFELETRLKTRQDHTHKTSHTQSGQQISRWAQLHCQAPVPLLPNEWQFAQSLLDKLLAKKLEYRFKTGDDIIEALKFIQISSIE